MLHSTHAFGVVMWKVHGKTKAWRSLYYLPQKYPKNFSRNHNALRSFTDKFGRVKHTLTHKTLCFCSFLHVHFYATKRNNNNNNNHIISFYKYIGWIILYTSLWFSLGECTTLSHAVQTMRNNGSPDYVMQRIQLTWTMIKY